MSDTPEMNTEKVTDTNVAETKATVKKTTAKKTSAKKATRPSAKKETMKEDTTETTAPKKAKKRSEKKTEKSTSRKRAGLKVEVVDMTDAKPAAADEPIIIEDPMAPIIVDESSGQRHGGFLNMLYRHPRNSMLAGVCGGIADYIGWDAALVRVLWVVAAMMTGGGGLLAYVALALLLPVGTKRDGFMRPGTIEMNEQNLSRASYGLIGLGVAWLLSNMGILSWLFNGASAVIGVIFWPAVLVTVGLLLLNRNGDKNYRDSLNSGWNNVRERANSVRTSGKVPTFDSEQRDSIRSSFIEFRQKMPIKRSGSNRVLAGVCGGIGRAIGIDANLVRLGFAVMSLGTAGTPLIAYVLLAVVLPSDGTRKRKVEDEIVIEEEIKFFD